MVVDDLDPGRAGLGPDEADPKPIVDHAQTRIRALEAFAAIKG